MGQRTRTDGVAEVARDQEDLYSRRNRSARRNVHHYRLRASRISKQKESSASIACSWLLANPEVERGAGNATRVSGNSGLVGAVCTNRAQTLSGTSNQSPL